MREEFEKAMGRRVARLRREKQLTQAQLAEILDVASETISRLERGISMPSLKTFENISHALNVPLKAIFDFEYPQKSQDKASEREIARIVNLLKTRKTEEIKIGFLILKNVFKVFKKL